MDFYAVVAWLAHFFHQHVVLRQLFDSVKGKYQKSKEIATDSNYLRCHALLSALHFPFETTCFCKQDIKRAVLGQQFWQMERNISVRPTEMTRPVKVDHLQSWSRIFRSDQTQMVRSIWCTNRNFRNLGLNGKRPWIGWSKFPTRYDQSEALSRSGQWHVISMEFLRSFLRRQFVLGETSGGVAKWQLFSQATLAERMSLWSGHKWRDMLNLMWTLLKAQNFLSAKLGQWGGRYSLYGQAPSDRGTLFRHPVYKKVGISPVKVYIMNGLGNLSFWSLKRPNGLTNAFYGCGRVEKTLWFCDLLNIHILKTVHLQRLKVMQNSNLGTWKGYHLSIEGIRKGYLFCQKWYIKGWWTEPQGRVSPYKGLLSTPPLSASSGSKA